MVFVTGGTGFIGSYIIKQLVQAGRPVLALRRSPTLPQHIDAGIWEAVQWAEGDVLDVVALADAMSRCTAVIHAAAVVSFHKKEEDRMRQVNVEGTANVVNAALESGTVQRIVHISSVAALGRTKEGVQKDESTEWKDNDNNTAYARSKHAAELEVWRGMAEGLEGVVLNPSTVLGYGNWHQSSCALFRNAYKEFPWYTDGVNGFVGVEDVAAAAVAFLDSTINEERFIVNAENRPFKWVFDHIAGGFGKKQPYKKATPFLGEIAWRVEALKHLMGGSLPLLTAETAKVAQSKTTFSNQKLLQALPQFTYQSLEKVIGESCARYLQAMEKGSLTL